MGRCACMEEVVFEVEQRYSLGEIADYIRSVADKLESGEGLVLCSGDSEVALDPPSNPVFEVKAEKEVEGGREEMSVEFEIEWRLDDDGGGGDLEIE